MRFIGIDPGQTGGIAVLSHDGQIVKLSVMPVIGKELDLSHLKAIFDDQIWETRRDGGMKVYLEKVHAMPKQGVSSTFKFGRLFGNIEGMISAFKIPYELIPAQTWAKAMHKGIAQENDPKQRSKLAVRRLFPDIDFTKSDRSSKMHEGLVDAVLIAEYGRRESVG